MHEKIIKALQTCVKNQFCYGKNVILYTEKYILHPFYPPPPSEVSKIFLFITLEQTHKCVWVT